MRAGEVVAIAGMVGSGRTEVAEAVFGERIDRRRAQISDRRRAHVLLQSEENRSNAASNF